MSVLPNSLEQVLPSPPFPVIIPDVVSEVF